MTDNKYNNLLNLAKNAMDKVSKPSETKPSVDPQVLANMKTHYSSIMTEGATNFGGNSISKSIFSKIDTDGNKELSLEEINSANLDEIILNTLENNMIAMFDAQEYFGDSYTQSAAQTDPTSSKSITEQIIDNNIKEAALQILDYADKHPENTKIQVYVRKLEEMIMNDSLIGLDIEHENAAGQNLSASADIPYNAIIIDNRDQLHNLSTRNVLKTLLHELGHAISGDDLDSIAEEIMVETNAIELAKEISGKDAFEVSIEKWASQYKGYPIASPGTYNIPLNAGITTKYEPQEVSMEDNKLTIKSKPDENGNITEDHVVFGTQKDNDGNPIPVSAQRVIVNSSGETIFSVNYGEYDTIKKAFNDRGLVQLQQYKFENKTEPTRFGLNGIR